MDPFTIMALGSVAAPVIGGLFGMNQADKQRDQANAYQQQALAQYAGIETPEIEDMMLALEQYKSQGVLTPELEQLFNLTGTDMENIQVDPRLKNEQMNALEQMSGLAQGNIQPGDVAGFELARRNSAADSTAKQNQIMQSMQERGQGGSGAELLARLNANQNSNDSLQNAQLEQAKAMQAARMQALEQSASMASGIRSQDYGQAKDLASARDAIANFNAQNSQAVNSRNTNTKNSAAAANLNQAQTLANANVDTQNKQQTHNKGLQQTDFNNKLNLAAGKSGQYNAMATNSNNQAANTAAQWAGIGQGVGTGMSALAGKFGGNAKPNATENKLASMDWSSGSQADASNASDDDWWNVS